MSKQLFTGVFTALITPFDAQGTIDSAALRAIVEAQIKHGVQGLVAVGSTGESPTVSHDENLQVIKLVLDQAAGRVPVIAGTGSNSTSEALDMSAKAKALGAAATLQVVPYYNKPNQEGMYRHFMAIADAVDLPMILYNIPGRTGKNMEAATIVRLAAHPNIVSLKDASGGVNQIMEIREKVPEHFTILSGDDALTLPMMSLGGHGVISVASHLVPQEMVALCQAAAKGDFAKARTIHYKLLELFTVLFLDTNPIPIKFALSLLGQCQEQYRLPLCSTNESVKAQVAHALKALHLK